MEARYEAIQVIPHPVGISPAKWMTFGLATVDAAIWIYALASVPRLLFGV